MRRRLRTDGVKSLVLTKERISIEKRISNSAKPYWQGGLKRQAGYSSSSAKGGGMSNGNGSRFVDPTAESAVVGTIVTSLFDRIPENKLIPPKAFHDERWRIIYGAAYSLRMAGAPVCAGRVNDLIELHRRDTALQKAFDPTETFRWKDWPNHCDQSLAFCPSTLSVEHSLETLGRFFENRESVGIAKRLEAGELSPREAIEALREITPESRGLPPMVSAKKLCASPPPTPPEVIEGILHQGGKMALGGGSKSFKTWTLLELAICIATGREWLGFPTAQGKVLYCNFELPAFSIEQRIREISEACGVEVPEALQLWNLRGHAADAGTILPIISREAKRSGFLLIVLDPLYKLLGARDENASRDMANLMNEIERVAVETGAAVAFGSHFAKGNASQKESMDRISGSGVFARDPDTIITMTRHEQDNAFSVEMTLRNFPPQEPFVVRRQHPLMVIDGKLDPAKLKKPLGREAEHKPSDILEHFTNGIKPANGLKHALRKPA